MSVEGHFENPFDHFKASTLSDGEILDHWVDISADQGGLLELLKPRLKMPMLLLGGKGSGKTHLMRYCSSPVQAARYGGNLRKAVDAEKYLGIYVLVEGINTGKFAGKGQTDDAWNSIFNAYFELWLSTSLLNVLQVYVDQGAEDFNEHAFIGQVSRLFDIDVSGQFTSLQTLQNYLTRERQNIDYVVNNSALSGELSGISIAFSPGRLVYGLPAAIASSLPALLDSTFVYLVDEAENFTEPQQRFLNTLIRHQSGNATMKVGARLYGIKTLRTLSAGEQNRVDAEFQQVELDGFLRDHKAEYETLVRGLVVKRLQKARLIQDGVRAETLDQFFEELDSQRFWAKPTLELVASADSAGVERPYFKKLRAHLAAVVDDVDLISRVIKNLELKECPFLERTNIFIFYRRWPKVLRVIESVSETIGIEARSVWEHGRSSVPDYAKVLDHFDSDILAQLYRECRRRVPYAGVKTLVTLSQGIPRNFLSLLKNIYRRSLFAGEAPFVAGKISVNAQSDGVRDSATWFWEDAQPESKGPEVRDAVEALAIFFRTVRFSEKPAECDLCSFTTNWSAISETSQSVLELAENWSYLIGLRDGGKNKNTRSIDAKYQLGPMLAARWDLSESRRGTIEIKPDLANALFDSASRGQLPALLKARVRGMAASGVLTSAKNGDQDGLFS